MSVPFQLASGSVIGRDHVRKKTNNQDALYHYVDTTHDFIVAVVSDGCSKSIFSEVGSQIGCRLTVKLITENLRKLRSRGLFGSNIKDARFWNKVREDLRAKLYTIALDMGESLSEVILKYFLFTIVGVVITPKETIFFSIGDGVFAINGSVFELGPFPGNEPPYIGYSLFDPQAIPTVSQELLRFQIHPVTPTKELESFIIATDGIKDLMQSSGKKIPGQSGIVNDISEFWTDDRYYMNEYNVMRRLKVINGYTQNYEGTALTFDWDKKNIIRENGYLPDDTTLIVGRRIIQK